jgi:hypothetical protein
MMVHSASLIGWSGTALNDGTLLTDAARAKALVATSIDTITNTIPINLEFTTRMIFPSPHRNSDFALNNCFG